MPTDEVVERFANVHRSVHGDGWDVLQRVVTTCEQMLGDRGCTRITHARDLAACLRETTPVMRGRGDRSVDVYVHGEERVGVKYARAVLDASTTADPDCRVVIVSVEGPTPFTRKECEGRPVQFFAARDLCYNVTRHALVPRHERVASHPDVASLPRILDTDRVVQYYDWPVGACVRVVRVFGGHEPVSFFRVVVSAASS